MNALHGRVIKLAKEGVPPRDIAGTECVSQDKIYYILREARKRGETIPYFSTRPDPNRAAVEPPKQIVIGLRLHRMLETVARKRGVSPNELARDLIETALLRKAAQDV